MRLRRLAFLAVFGLSTAILAEEPATVLTVAPQPGWGIVDASVLALTAWDFEEVVSGWTTTESFYRYRTGPSPYLIAGLHLPTGAIITGIAMEGCDTTASGSVNLLIYRCPSGTEDSCVNIGVTSGVGGTPGCAIFSVDLTGSNIVVNNATTTYMLIASSGATNFSTSIRGARVFYRLQVSPAPLAATFGDVPTNHPFFRFVEALADSGITAGCGGGNYCPDNPLTRGQMAVFLSTALGLHWD